MERMPMPNQTIARWEYDNIQWFTVAAFARYISVSNSQVRRWIRNDKLPHRRVGRRIIILLNEVQSLIPLIWHWLGRPTQVKTSKGY